MAGWPRSSSRRRPLPRNCWSRRSTPESTASAQPIFGRASDQIGPTIRRREYYLTDIVEILNRVRANARGRRCGIENPAEVLGINNRVELAQVDAIFRARKVEELMLAGVTIEKPETVSIDAGARIGMDTVIEPFVRISGSSVIGEQCTIGACSILEDVRLGDGVQVGPFTSISASRLDDGAQVGPYARLRMGAHVETGAHVGNFVELKKTRLGAGAKAMHLAYLGDSNIGEKVNIGAGTITCNYDGVKKHATTIGDGAFVGSNSTLVAPVEIGAGAALAAGSVITKPGFPPDALALGRAHQVIRRKLGEAKRRRGESEPRLSRGIQPHWLGEALGHGATVWNTASPPMPPISNSGSLSVISLRSTIPSAMGCCPKASSELANVPSPRPINTSV